jgi:carbamoyltransferase
VRVLGISAHYHDAAVALLDSGVPIALAQEERFTRIKHDPSFPKNALNFVFRLAGSRKVDYVVFYERPFLKFERFTISTLSFFPHSHGVFREGMLSWIKEKLWIKSLILENVEVDESNILFLPHHLSHAASAFLCSPFEDAAILTVDGVGEWSTATTGFGHGEEIVLTDEIRFPHSLGLLYSTFTAFLGFRVNDGEYKVMGMAPYGSPTYLNQMRKLVDTKQDGSFRLNLDYFSFHTSTRLPYNDRFVQLFGSPRDPKMEHRFEQRHADIAASVQRITEEIITKLAWKSYKDTGLTNLCIAGGVGLNSVANYRILKETPIKSIFVQPAAGDAGAALGAALYVHHSLLHNKRNFVMEHAYYGEQFQRNSVRDFLEERNLAYSEYSDAEIPNFVAEEIERGKIVGLVQGRTEWGPRALGNRSILADARRKEMLKTVNLRVKFRESFRPFAPSVLHEDAERFFEVPANQYPPRFMLYVCPVRERSLLPAITHVDGSARPQVVLKEFSPRYHAILDRFKELTGVGCFLNTSFNLSGEPIVNSPKDAYKSFSNSKIDTLVLENFVVTKDSSESEHS